MDQAPLLHKEHTRQEDELDTKSSRISHEIENAINKNESTTEGWRKLESYMSELGFTEKDVNSYISTAMIYHGSEIIVRRGSLNKVFESLEKGKSVHVSALDKEPNAALLGGPKDDINGIEVALTGGFGWFVENKVAGVFGFVPSDPSLSNEGIESNSLSNAKEGSHLMRRIDGDIDSKDIIFIMLRIHKSAYPVELLRDEDYDDRTGEPHPFVLRLYAKNRQAQ